MNSVSRAPQRWLYPFVLVACVFVVYGQTLFFDFVSYDDYDLVKENTHFLADISNVGTSFTMHAFEAHRSEGVYYRPLLLISYIADYHIWGLRPFGYHLTNLLLHCIAVLLVFHLTRRLLENDLFALVVSLCFSVHLVQTESVAWIAGRNDVLLGLFVILMLYSYVRYREATSGRGWFFAGTIASATAALLTKESAAFFLLLLPAYDLCMRRMPIRSLVTRLYLSLYAPIGVLLAIYLAVRVYLFGAIIGTEQLYGITPLLTRFEQIPAMISEHLRLLIVPTHLSILHPLEDLFWFGAPGSILAIIITLSFLVAVWLSWNRDRLLCFGLLWVAIGLLPTLNVIPVAVPILEHRLYTVLPGAAIAATRSLFLLSNAIHRPKFFVAITLIVVVVLAIGTVHRLPVWRNSEALWTDAIRQSPNVSRAHFNLAGYYFERGRYDSTIVHLRTYIRLNPTEIIGYSKLRQTYFLAGRYEEAATVCRQMIEHDPTSPERYLDLELLYERLNKFDSALAVCHDGLRLCPTSFELHYRVGILSEHAGLSEVAEREFRRTIELAPEYAPGYFSLGQLFARRGEQQRALDLLDEGAKYGTPPTEVSQLLDELRRKGLTDREMMKARP
jgi:Flp pilus assembly protein TadD